MRYFSVLLLLIWVATLHAEIVRLLADSAEITSTNDDGKEVLAVLQDTELKTYIQSKDGDQQHEWQYLDLTYDDTREFATVAIGFWRWNDEWCWANNEECKRTWNRLAGLAVGISNGTDHVSLCDVVPEYTDKIPAEFVDPPSAIYAIVRCNSIKGSTIHIAQTKPWSVLQLSEVYVYSNPPEDIEWITKIVDYQYSIYETAETGGSEPIYTEWKQWEDKDDDNEHGCTDCWSGAVRMTSSATVVAVLLAKHFLA